MMNLGFVKTKFSNFEKPTLKNNSINIINIKLGIKANIYLEWEIITTEKSYLTQFSSVQSLSRDWLFATPWIAARQAFSKGFYLSPNHKVDDVECGVFWKFLKLPWLVLEFLPLGVFVVSSLVWMLGAPLG